MVKHRKEDIIIELTNLLTSEFNDTISLKEINSYVNVNFCNVYEFTTVIFDKEYYIEYREPQSEDYTDVMLNDKIFTNLLIGILKENKINIRNYYKFDNNYYKDTLNGYLLLTETDTLKPISTKNYEFEHKQAFLKLLDTLETINISNLLFIQDNYKKLGYKSILKDDVQLMYTRKSESIYLNNNEYFFPAITKYYLFPKKFKDCIYFSIMNPHSSVSFKHVKEFAKYYNLNIDTFIQTLNEFCSIMIKISDENYYFKLLKELYLKGPKNVNL